MPASASAPAAHTIPTAVGASDNKDNRQSRNAMNTSATTMTVPMERPFANSGRKRSASSRFTSGQTGERRAWLGLAHQRLERPDFLRT